MLPKTVLAVVGLAALADPALAARGSHRHLHYRRRQLDRRDAGSQLVFGARKRGVSYDNPDLANALVRQTPGCSWGYNWNPVSKGLDAKVTFVPTVKSDVAMFTDNWQDNARGAPVVFGANEPDKADQANMDVATALDFHARYMKPLKGKVRIGAPSVSNSDRDNEGLKWLQSFMQQCDQRGPDECPVDFCPVHFYGPAVEDLQKHVEQARDICGNNRTVWVTELAKNDVGAYNPYLTPDFVTDAAKYLDANEHVEGYSFFMCKPGFLVNQDGSLTDAGRAYVALN